ncbi:rubrerythrin [Paenibacillus taihuensis]|uniref:Rubrerythrin n=1 Tax=Paenibacillus taihuensis TaxID=1156355 RepID=A0A3D9QUZ4_9BACL|nr:ferritin-like domain-containing protein [Paenibacillus taihuensis]REE68044.1 rubrerythrin [Paenibacillus taihuensis]
MYSYYYSPMDRYWREMTYKSLPEALTLIKQSVEGEREDELFYDYLISVAPTKEEQQIIASIRDDERKHNQMFRQIYHDLTGQTLPASQAAAFEKPASYLAGVKKAFFGELGAVERYRDIRAGLPSRYHRDMVFEIITDEQKHADKYNYIMILNASRPT